MLLHDFCKHSKGLGLEKGEESCDKLEIHLLERRISQHMLHKKDNEKSREQVFVTVGTTESPPVTS